MPLIGWRSWAGSCWPDGHDGCRLSVVHIHLVLHGMFATGDEVDLAPVWVTDRRSEGSAHR